MKTDPPESCLGYFKSHPMQCLGYLGLLLCRQLGLRLWERQSTELHLERGSKGVAEGRCRLQEKIVFWELVHLGYGWGTWGNTQWPAVLRVVNDFSKSLNNFIFFQSSASVRISFPAKGRGRGQFSYMNNPCPALTFEVHLVYLFSLLTWSAF